MSIDEVLDLFIYFFLPSLPNLKAKWQERLTSWLMQPFKTARYHCLFSKFSPQEMMSISELKTPCRCSLYMMWLLGLVNLIQNLLKFVYPVPAALLKNVQAALGAQTEISSPAV